MDMFLLKEEYLASRENYTSGKPYQGETRLIHRYFATLNAVMCTKDMVGYDVVPFVRPARPLLPPYVPGVEDAGTAARTAKDTEYKALTDVWTRKIEAIPAKAQKAMGIVKSLVNLELQNELDSVVEALAAGTSELDRLSAMISHLKTHYSPVQTNEVNRVKMKLTVVNDYCGIEMFFNVLEDICQLLDYVDGVDRPGDDALKAMIPGACHNPQLVIALEQMRTTPAWTGYTYRQAKDAILKMARRSPQMLEGAKQPGGKESSGKKASTDGGKSGGKSGKSDGKPGDDAARGMYAGGRGGTQGRGDMKYGPGGGGRGGPGRGGTGGRFGGSFQGGRLPSGGALAGVKCFLCGGNHFQRDCPSAKGTGSATGQAAMGDEAPIKCTYCGRLHVGGVSGCWKRAWDMQQPGGGRNTQGKRAVHYEDGEEYDDEHPAKETRRS